MEAYILAGGKSTRMGEDKGLKKLNGIPIIQYSIEVLSQCFPSVKINTDKEEYKQFGLELVADKIKNKGPLGGIHAVLDHSKKDVFVVSCDMPFITSEAINYLVNNLSTNLATIASYSGRIQPLFGIYTYDALQFIEDKLADNQLKLTEFIIESESKVIDLTEIIEKDIFSNINTQEEFKKIEKNFKTI